MERASAEAVDQGNSLTASAVPADSRSDTSGLGGHPRGLTTLFFTEMWERFSYYGMRAILVLYMVAPASEGGLGFSIRDASMIYGTYTMLVYMGSIPGGLVADRWLGARTSVLVGGVIIALGHFALIFTSLPSFFGGLLLIILGTGLLKPNISSMLGMLYSKDDHRRDGGFSIFYMGINIGAALAPLVCGYLAQSAGFKRWLVELGMEPSGSWHWGFAAAGVGMSFGLIHYLLQQSRLGTAGLRAPRDPKQLQSVPNDGDGPLTVDEWGRIGAIGILFFFTMLFWAVYEQGGSSLNLFADKFTRCEVFGWQFPSSWLQSFQALFVILLAPFFSWLWIRCGEREPSSPIKFAYGLAFLGIGISLMVPASFFATAGKVSALWLMAVYFLEVTGELCLSPVGLSTVTKLAPRRMVGMMMGVWFLASSFGNMLAGWLSGFFDPSQMSSLMILYGGMGASALVAAVLLICLSPVVKRLMAGVR